jgi:hypothetical protein
LYVLPAGYQEYILLGTNKHGLPIWRSNGRGSNFCEAVNSAWLSWLPSGKSSKLHGGCLTLDGACHYNVEIRERLGESWGVGQLTEWWIAAATNAACVDLGLALRHPNLKVPAPHRDGEIGLAGRAYTRPLFSPT